MAYSFTGRSYRPAEWRPEGPGRISAGRNEMKPCDMKTIITEAYRAETYFFLHRTHVKKEYFFRIITTQTIPAFHFVCLCVLESLW